MMYKTLRIVVSVLLALATQFAQAAEDKATGVQININVPSEPVVASSSSFTGKIWLLEELIGETLPIGQVAPYILLTNANDLVGFGGCNYFIGKYRTGDDGRIIFSSLRASHQHCPETSERETSLLTSLVMANTVQVDEEKLTFLMDSSILMNLRHATDIAVEELIRQGGLVKARSLKARSKKKKGAVKSKKRRKTSAVKISKKPQKTQKTVKKQVKLK